MHLVAGVQTSARVRLPTKESFQTRCRPNWT